MRIIACGLATGMKGWAQLPGVRYSVAVRPEKTLLGSPVVAELTCVASQNGVKAFTFEDGSLELELRRLHAATEPLLDFPNRVVTRQGSIEVRTRPSGHQQLTAGKRLQRRFDLIRVFPRWILDTGDYEFSYRLGPDLHPWRVGPARITITSGPAAIPLLFALLAHEDAGVRSRAAGILHRMTAHVTGYSATGTEEERRETANDWLEWWHTTGEKMPWNYRAEGATFGPEVEGDKESHKLSLGGLAYVHRGFDQGAAATIKSVLGEWLDNPSAGADRLQGRQWIADQKVTYPGQEIMVDPGPEIATIMASALGQIHFRETSGLIILATAARMIDARYIEPLADLEHQAGESAMSQRISFFAGGLLDVLDPGRTPVGA